MKNTAIAVTLLALAGVASAKLPPPQLDDAAKAKAAETAAKAAWQGKLDAYQLCKAQDRVAALYKKTAGSSKPAAASSAAKMVTPAAAAASAAPTTPVAYTSPAACADPGPFAFNPPEQK